MDGWLSDLLPGGGWVAGWVAGWIDNATCKEEGLGPFIHQELTGSGGGWVERVVVVESLHISCIGKGEGVQKGLMLFMNGPLQVGLLRK